MAKALIVGAGLGGLSTALRLAKKGYQVSIVEKYKQAGGQLNQIRKNGFVWDLGPTYLSMSYIFEDLSKDCDIDLPFKLIELDKLYAINFNGNAKTFHVYKNIKKLAAEFEEVEPDFEKKIISFLGQAGKLFHDTENLVFRRAFNNKCQYLLSLSRIPSKYGRKFFRGIWSELGKHFESSEAKELLSLVSFFLGSSPYNKSAVFTILSYIELVHDGFFNVQDGMYKVVEGLLREVEKAGVEITYNSEITGYIGSGRKIYSLIDHTGEAYNADVYVVNSNAPYFKNKIFNRKKYKPSKLNDMPWNLAPLTIYLGLDQKVDELNLHHYFLDKNFEEYTRGILNNSADLFQPNYYVNTPSKVNPLCAPKGCENLFIFCPVPNKIHKSDWSDRETIVDNIIANLSSRIGVNLESMILEKIVLGPMQWEQQFNLYQSNSLNQSKNLNHFGGYRPSNKDEKFNNVFYVGASTIPGAGLPMSVISSKLVTDRIIKKFGSFN